MKKVLVLDNDEDVLEIIHEALTYAGFDVNGVIETDELFSLIEDYHPDIVLIDHLLNGTSGGELCQQLKADKRTAALPVILISAYPLTQKTLSSFVCDDFIAKPFDLDDLVMRVKRLTEEKIIGRPV